MPLFSGLIIFLFLHSRYKNELIDEDIEKMENKEKSKLLSRIITIFIIIIFLIEIAYTISVIHFNYNIYQDTMNMNQGMQFYENR